MQLYQLSSGDNFELVGLEKAYRKLFVKKVTECSVLIGGERKEKDGEETVWKPLSEGYTISTGCEVKQLKGKTEIKVRKKREKKEC